MKEKDNHSIIKCTISIILNFYFWSVLLIILNIQIIIIHENISFYYNIFIINCSSNKVTNYHGIKSLESKFNKIQVNVTK